MLLLKAEAASVCFFKMAGLLQPQIAVRLKMSFLRNQR